MGTIRQQIISLLEEHPMGVRELSKDLGITEKVVLEHLEHIRRSVAAKGKRLSMTSYECLSCGYVFRERSRLGRPGRCPKCRQSHIQGVRFRIE